MMINSQTPAWATAAVLIGRLIFAAVFLMALTFKVMDIDGTAAFIASAGFPVPKLLAWLAALFELALTVCLLTGAFFAEAALLAAAYVLFLAFRSEEHTSELQSRRDLVCRLLLEKKKKI